jgi:hypothetical protein
MTQHPIKPNTEHQEFTLLLPWYVNKTLQGAELKSVEAHLSVCLICKREVIQLQKLAQAVVHEGTLDSAEQASFNRLKMRLHGQSQPSRNIIQQEQDKSTVSAHATPFGKPKKRRWTAGGALARPALAMAAAVLLSLTVIMPQYAENDMPLGNSFRTLSDGQQESIDANEIRVVFAENIDQQQKDKILERIHGQVIDTPTAQGVYTVRLHRDIASKHLLEVVELLRKDSNIVFAEPAYALLSSMHAEK